jgi:hypothetical protein
MSRKPMIMFGMVIGFMAGGYAPTLLGADTFSVMHFPLRHCLEALPVEYLAYG